MSDAPLSGLDNTVAIVGAGPAGLTLSLCLAHRGVDSVVIERRAGPSTHPRAHYINTRTMELFRLWGLHDAVVGRAYPEEHLPFDQLAALGGLTKEDRAQISPTSVASCAQDQIEAVLMEDLAPRPQSTIRWSTTFVSAADQGDRVIIDVDGLEGPAQISARWLVAADGAASSVRELLGISMLGDGDLGSLINVYIEGLLYPEGEVAPLARQSTNPEAAGAFISMDGSRRFCFHHPYDPEKEKVADFDATRCHELVCRAAELPLDHPVDVVSIRPWTMTALVADQLRSGSIFLIGDAAHAFPPTGGFGMNSGIQDARNLAWKLVATLDGTGGPALLDSYEPERQPVAFLNTAQSLRNANRGVGSDNPSPQAELIDERATVSVRSAAAEATTPEERGAIEMLEHAGAIGQDLGFAYEHSPVVVDDGRPRPDIQIARYVPNACPGSRAPHVPLRTGSRTLSILDLFDGEFVLVVGADADAWRAAAQDVDERSRPTVVTVGPGAEFDTVDGIESFEDRYGISSRGAVLVRPDGHVAFRSEGSVTDPTTALEDALRTASGHP